MVLRSFGNRLGGRDKIEFGCSRIPKGVYRRTKNGERGHRAGDVDKAQEARKWRGYAKCASRPGDGRWGMRRGSKEVDVRRIALDGKNEGGDGSRVRVFLGNELPGMLEQ